MTIKGNPCKAPALCSTTSTADNQYPEEEKSEESSSTRSDQKLWERNSDGRKLGL